MSDPLSTHTYLGYVPAIGQSDSLLGYDNNQQLVNVVVIPDSGLDGGVLTIPVEIISSQTASNSASILFTDLETIYSKYELVITNMQCETNETTFTMKASVDNGANWIVASNNTYVYVQGVTFDSAANSATVTDLMGTVDVMIANPAAFNAVIRFTIGPVLMGAIPQTNVFFDSSFVGSTNGYGSCNGTAIFKNSNPVNALQFIMSSGNIVAGKFTLRGYL